MTHLFSYHQKFLDTDLKAEVDRCLELRAEYKTVVQRAQLAQTFYDLGKEELKFCDKLVHEQHLQHQVSLILF